MRHDSCATNLISSLGSRLGAHCSLLILVQMTCHCHIECARALKSQTSMATCSSRVIVFGPRAAGSRQVTSHSSCQTRLSESGKPFLGVPSHHLWHQRSSRNQLWQSEYHQKKVMPAGHRPKLAESVGSCHVRQRPFAVRAGSKGGLSAKVFSELQGKGLSTEPCPCGGGPEKDRYQTCCARFHRGGLAPRNALQLMSKCSMP